MLASSPATASRQTRTLNVFPPSSFFAGRARTPRTTDGWELPTPRLPTEKAYPGWIGSKKGSPPRAACAPFPASVPFLFPSHVPHSLRTAHSYCTPPLRIQGWLLQGPPASSRALPPAASGRCASHKIRNHKPPHVSLLSTANASSYRPSREPCMIAGARLPARVFGFDVLSYS